MTVVEDKYLLLRGTTYYYKRWVPEQYSHVIPERYVKTSLRTKSLEIARMRRDDLFKADNAYWNALALEAMEQGGVSEATLKVKQSHYKAAVARALSFGYIYKTADEMYEERDVDAVIERVQTLKSQFDVTQQTPPTREANALLGGLTAPKSPTMSVTSCFQLYIDEIEFDALLKKSPAQKRSWENSKRIAITYFVEVIGDINMTDITRDHAIEFRNWWAKRIRIGDENGKRPTPYTANRRIGTMRTLFDKYFSYIGEEDRPNPFRKLSFKDTKTKKRPPFSTKWIREKVLNPGYLDGLNPEARGVLLAMIETGARPSEICNLRPENIHLNVPVPYIEIREQDNREVKASASNREIPLVGISLEAMKANPRGFPRYYDKDTVLSNVLMKYFKENNLLESDKHKIYSIRHSFEDRMLEAGIDHDLRCTLMGHKLKRPSYGSGGSIDYRRDELLKIVHPFSSELEV